MSIDLPKNKVWVPPRAISKHSPGHMIISLIPIYTASVPLLSFSTYNGLEENYQNGIKATGSTNTERIQWDHNATF